MAGTYSSKRSLAAFSLEGKQTKDFHQPIFKHGAFKHLADA